MEIPAQLYINHALTSTSSKKSRTDRHKFTQSKDLPTQFCINQELMSTLSFKNFINKPNMVQFKQEIRSIYQI